VKIAIDARELAGQPTGVGRYLAEILRAWSRLPAAASHQFRLCAPAPIAVEGAGGLRTETAAAPGHGTLWEQRVLPRLAAGADILFAPAYSGPIRARVPMVVTIHDVSFAAHPEWFSWREGLRRRVITRLSARRAAKIITVSDFSKREIVRHLGVAQSSVEVIYSGATTLGAAAVAAAREPLVLYVGSLFNRRHVPELIDGFTRLAGRHPSARLEIVGDNRTRPHVDVEALIARSPAAGRIRARAYIGDAELAALYARASAFAFLSDYEGFAMTPMEALRAGVPVVLLDTEVAREIYGPAAMYVARPDAETIATALERALFDDRARGGVLAAAAVQLERYSWEECARRTLQVLLACAAR
jgi:glycosyltransferase involved in cell wall biosynthesis